MKNYLILVILSLFFSSGFSQIFFCGESFPLNNKNAVSKLYKCLDKNKHELDRIQNKLYLLDYFSTVFEKFNLPDDLKFLAVVESRLEPAEKSGAGATGIWQIMPADGKDFGLNIDSENNYDERNSIAHSTYAACREFVWLYNQLHSWPLVCAAYNWGIGNMKKAILKQSNDYFSMTLNSETGAYVYEAISFKMLYYQRLAKEPLFNFKTNTLPSKLFNNKSSQKTYTLFSSPKKTDTLIRALIAPNTTISINTGVKIIILDSLNLSGFSIKEGTMLTFSVYKFSERINANFNGIDIDTSLSQFNFELLNKHKIKGLDGSMAFDGIETDEKGIFVYLNIASP